MDFLGNYFREKIPKSRAAILDHLELASKKHYVYGLIEVNETEARKKIRKLKDKNENPPSFTAWLLVCIGKAVSLHKSAHAVMRKRKELIIFDDVDISITVEKNVKGNKVPMPLVIRKCNEKTVMEITHEIREAQTKTIDRTAVLENNKSDKLVKMYPYIPKFLRK